MKNLICFFKNLKKKLSIYLNFIVILFIFSCTIANADSDHPTTMELLFGKKKLDQNIERKKSELSELKKQADELNKSLMSNLVQLNKFKKEHEMLENSSGQTDSPMPDMVKLDQLIKESQDAFRRSTNLKIKTNKLQGKAKGVKDYERLEEDIAILTKDVKTIEEAVARTERRKERELLQNE